MIPYGRQWIDEDDIRGVVEVLRSDWLTTGPMVERFESRFAAAVGATHAVAVSSGTAGLHCAAHAAGIGPRDEVIVTPMTFAASANCIVYCGGTPVFADVQEDTLLIDPGDVRRKVTPRTRAIIAVDYAGQPCDYEALRDIARTHNLSLIADACHSLGGARGGRAVGSMADLNVFSFHPVKHITTGEGGMITTGNREHAARMRMFRNHGISTDFRERQRSGAWFYEMLCLGNNYRLTDLQCALGISQLGKLDGWVQRRQAIAARYDRAFATLRGVKPLGVQAGVRHAYHLYVLKVDPSSARRTRNDLFAALRRAEIGVNVHYIPVHLHPYYRNAFGTREGMCPVAEAAYERILSIPMFPAMRDEDVERVIEAVVSMA